MYILENEQLRISVIPQRGAKIAGLYDKDSGTELLYQPEERLVSGLPLSGGGSESGFEPGPGPGHGPGPGPGSGLAAPLGLGAPPGPGLGAPFDASQAWGWDEMFPAIQAETFEDEAGRKMEVPDHGEVWTRSWKIVETNGADMIALSVEGDDLRYRFSRTTRLLSGTVRHEYTLRNFRSYPLPWMWAAHPLFVLTENATLTAPPTWDTVRNAHDSPFMPGYDQLYPYPGDTFRLDTLPSPRKGVVQKYFFEHANTDAAAEVVLNLPEIDRRISVRADPLVAPWYGVWCNAGGLFGHANVAVEPASAPMDSLSAAARLGRLPQLAPAQSISWWLEVEVRPRGDSNQ